MRLATADDLPQISRICNDPAIRVWAADGAPPFDAARAMAPNFAVLGDEGCFVATLIEPSRYMVHTSLLPAYRGAPAVVASHRALGVAFCETDALELETIAPSNTTHVALFARQMGFRPRFKRRGIWPHAGQLHDLQFLSMTVLDWALGGACEASGAWFHEQIDVQRQAFNAAAANHVDSASLHILPHQHDAAHDAVVGAAVEMVRAGRPDKAVGFYNYWARVAGYQQIAIVSRDPLCIDIRQCVLKVEGDRFTVEAPHA